MQHIIAFPIGLKNHNKRGMYYFVDYNGKFIVCYKSVRACLNYIGRKRLQDDYQNTLRICDQKGNIYNLINGEKIK